MCAVLADSMPLAIPADTYSLNETLGAKPEAAHIDWQLYRPKYGNSVEISSGVQPNAHSLHVLQRTQQHRVSRMLSPGQTGHRILRLCCCTADRYYSRTPPFFIQQAPVTWLLVHCAVLTGRCGGRGLAW